MMKKLLPSEKQICNNIVELLNYQGCFCWRNNAGLIPITNKQGKTRRIMVGRKGESDIIGIYRRKEDHCGIFCAFEVKTPKRRKMVTFHQEQFINMIKEMGGIATVVTSPEEALETLKDYEIYRKK